MRFDVEDSEKLDLSFSNGSNLKTDAKIPILPEPSKVRRVSTGLLSPIDALNARLKLL
jgi:hypothetical protein